MTNLDTIRGALTPQTRSSGLKPRQSAAAMRGHHRNCRDAMRMARAPSPTTPLPAWCCSSCWRWAVVMHATTKYLGGRSDVLGGAVVTRADDEHFAQLRTAQLFGGAVPSPFDCWLVMRSLPTLPYRMQAHCANATKVAEFLQQHDQVSVVHYPGLSNNPFHAVASKQMSGFGGMLSFEVKGGKDAAMALAAHVEIFTCATSLAVLKPD
jgi:cystathionine gamma-synthase